MTRAEKLQELEELRDKGYSEFHIENAMKLFDQRERMKEHEKEMKYLSPEENAKYLEECRKRSREIAIEAWKKYKYEGVWDYGSIDDPEFIRLAMINPHHARYVYLKKIIGDEIDDL